MLTLMLLRHAKAGAAGRGDDFARALTEKGERDATEVGDFLAEHDLLPNVALISTSVRTSRTYEIVATRAGCAASVRREDVLYNATEARILHMLRDLDTPARNVLVVGHNPGIMDAAVALARQGDLAEIDRLRGRFPPCGLAVLGFDAPGWSAAIDAGGRLDALVFPEDFVSGG